MVENYAPLNALRPAPGERSWPGTRRTTGRRAGRCGRCGAGTRRAGSPGACGSGRSAVTTDDLSDDLSEDFSDDFSDDEKASSC